MRRSLILLAVGAAALLALTACGKNDDSPAIDAAGGQSATTMGSMGSMSGAMCDVGADSLKISASTAAKFDKDCLAAAAGSPVTITFDNKDSGVSHSIAVLKEHTDMTPLFASEVVVGPATVTASGGPLEAGTYHFHCTVHPTTMKGILIVK